jgi:prepilin-type N-terminal cleavage/methylation domain-containing protein
MAGFTVTETMVVLAIVAIVLAIAVPNFVRFTARDKVEACAYDVERTLILARQKAVAKRRSYRVTFNVYDTSYYVERKEGVSWVRDPDETFSLHPSVQLGVVLGGNPANNVLVLEPQGTVASDDAPGRMTLFNDRADSATVSIVRTGRIRTRVN